MTEQQTWQPTCRAHVPGREAHPGSNSRCGQPIIKGGPCRARRTDPELPPLAPCRSARRFHVGEPGHETVLSKPITDHDYDPGWVHANGEHNHEATP